MDQPTLAELHALLARRDQGPRGLLGLDATAPPAEIARAYHAMVARIHPANFPTDVERHRAAWRACRPRCIWRRPTGSPF